MKKTLSVLFALLMSCITASAQIQNGYVRSQGTSYNRTGSPLKGARVFVKGLNGSKVTAPNGTFNFNLGGGKTQFCISSVTLKGYTLLSPLAPAYNVGKAAVEIVMQSREERIQNEARISKVIEERITKSYNAKTRELQKKITTLEKALSDKKKNSDELETQIRSLKEQLGNLDNQYLKRNELIDKMVEEYVNLDYATMNNRKAELCSYIENGELGKADSLLNTIDINKEMNDIMTLNRDIEEKESMLAKEKEIRKNKIETACMYWRGKYDIAIQNMQYDSAAVYVKNLADVDTCNLINVSECAYFLCEQNCFKEAEEYYIKILKKIEHENDSTSTIRRDWLYNNLAILYSKTQRFKESEKMHKAALAIREHLSKDNPNAFRQDLASSYINLAGFYSDTRRFKESEDMYKTALVLVEQLVKENPNAYKSYLARLYNNLANFYHDTKRFKESEGMHKAALMIDEQLVKENPNKYNLDLANDYNNLASLYIETRSFKESEYMYKAALVIYEQLSKENPNAYESYLALSYNNLAGLYANTNRFKESENMYKTAIAIRERLAKDNPRVYEPYLASSYHSLAVLYLAIQRFKECEDLNKAALAIREQLAKENPRVYEPNLADCYKSMANLYYVTKRFKESEDTYKMAIVIYERLAKENPKVYEPKLGQLYNDLAALYRFTKSLGESEEMYKAAIVIDERLAKENPRAYEPNLAKSYKNLAALYKYNQRFKESEDMYKAEIVIYERLRKENQTLYEPNLAASYSNLATLYSDTQRFVESEEMCKAAIDIYERLAKENPNAYKPDLAESYNNLAVVYNATQRYSKSEEIFKAIIMIYEQLAKENPGTYEGYLAMSYEYLMLQYSYLCYLYVNDKDYKTAYLYNKKALSLLKVNYEKYTEKTAYIATLINQSFYANLLGKFKEGEQYSLEAIKIDSTQHLAYTNLAAALLLQGRFEEADNLYREYKAEFKNVFLDDFAEFERLGVIPEERKADVERIKAILNE